MYTGLVNTDRRRSVTLLYCSEEEEKEEEEEEEEEERCFSPALMFGSGTGQNMMSHLSLSPPGELTGTLLGQAGNTNCIIGACFFSSFFSIQQESQRRIQSKVLTGVCHERERERE